MPPEDGLAVVSEDGAVDGEETASPEIIARDADLQDIFRDSSPASPLEGNVDLSVEPAPAPASISANDERLNAMQAELEALKEKNIELDTRNVILQSQFTEARRSMPAAQITPEAPKPGVMSFEEFRTKGAADPMRAVYDLVASAQAVGEDKIQEVFNKSNSSAAGLIERERAINADRSTSIAEYGDLFENNPKFRETAAKIYSQLTQHAPEVNGQRWYPGALYAAASTAFAQMVKAGAVNANPKVVQLRERKQPPGNPLVGETHADKSRTLASEFDARTLAVQKRVAESMGITLERYHKIYGQLKKNDPSYGG